MVEKKKENKSLGVLVFLFLFGLSIGVFDNYRDLWMSANDISTVAISHIKGISSLVTVLVLFYFTLRVPTGKLKKGMHVVLVLKMMAEVILILLNGSNQLFTIKFLMFFDIAFTQLIVSSTYPLMMNFAKDDVLYTKKSFVESIADKIGFFLVSLIIGKTIFSCVVDYNTCLILSLVFTFMSFVGLVSLNISSSSTSSTLIVQDVLSYFNKNKVLYLFLVVNLIGSVVWSTIVGMPMLTLTENLGFGSQSASFMILGLGIVSTVLSMIILKYLRFKNDHINLFFKFGVRVLLYLAAVITNEPTVLFVAIVYLLLTNSTHNFIFSSFFINNIDEKYSLAFTTLKYCTSLLGDAIGVFICGFVFNMSITFMALPAFVIAVLHYVLSTILVNEKKNFAKN